MRKWLVPTVLLACVVTLAGYLDGMYDPRKVADEDRFVSSRTLEQNVGWVSVEGAVYNLGDPKLKKHLRLSEVNRSQLTKERFVGYLAITLSELERSNGRNAPALVAVNGIVYDVSASRSWAGGNHKNQHNAGQELTHDITRLSPHGVGRIRSMPSYGVLVFTPTELARFNGNRTKSYFSVFGVVYDASQSRDLSGGKFYGFQVGAELTSEILSIPRYGTVLSQLYSIGVLVFDATTLRAFDGKSGKPFVMVGNRVYDISKKPGGLTPGTVVNAQIESDWYLVGYRLE